MAVLTPRNKEEFYQSINPETWFGADFCRKLYGYDISYPGFADKVIALFESFGRPNVKYIYYSYVWAENYFWSEEIRESGALEQVRKNARKNYERQVKACRKNLQNMNDSELLTRLQEVRQARQQF